VAQEHITERYHLGKENILIFNCFQVPRKLY
jgi:hypothetical protein